MTEVETASHISSAENGGQALRRRWSRRLSSGKHIVRIYWPAILLTVSGVAFYLWALDMIDEERVSGYSHKQDWAIYIAIALFGLHFIVRMQLACIPAMASLPDFDRLRWPSLRTTAISTGEILRAVFLHTLTYNVLILGLLGLLGLLIAGGLVYAEEGQTFWTDIELQDVIYSLLGYSAVGLSLSGLGFITSFKWDKPIAVIGGVFIPVILLILIGAAMFMRSSLWGYYDQGSSLYPVDVLTMLVAPEVYVLMGLSGGEVDLPSGIRISVIVWMLIEILIAFIIWQFVGIALTFKRAADK